MADNGGMADEPQTAPKPKARDLNELVRYTMWSVFRVTDRVALESGGLGNAAAEVAELLDQAAGKGIVTRGCYDVQGLRADDELAVVAAAELATATGVRGRPVATRVTRWGGALPQYTVGHLDRVAAIRAAVAAEPGLAVCGAAYDGVGIPACVATARAAAGQVLAFLAARTAAGDAGAVR